MAYISKSKRAYIGGFFFGEARFSDDHFFGRFFLEGEKKARVWRVKKGGVLERYTSITYFLYFLGKNREKVSSGE